MVKNYITIALAISVSFTATATAETIRLTMNTSALVSDLNDQDFSLEFFLENGDLITSNLSGGPHTNASNIVSITNFNFGGGFGFDPASDPAFLIDGGASGDIRTSVLLLANRPGNYFSQGFKPGLFLSFDLTFTNNVADSEILDLFTFAILDNQYFAIPTQGEGYLMQIYFDSEFPERSTWASDPNSPTSAGQFLSFDAPVLSEVTATPEPATFWILASGLLILLTSRKRLPGALRKSLPAAASLSSLLVLAVVGSVSASAAPQQEAPEIFTMQYKGRTVTYQVINGLAVVEGDMVIGTADVETDSKGNRSASIHRYYPASNSVNLSTNLWPKVAGVVTVPYTTVKGSANMTTAINSFNTLFAGKFRWVPRTNQRGYVEINLAGQSSNSCFATLGYTGGKEVLQGVLDGCNVSAMLHEMGHIMGFAHEQSRADRNSYIFIDFSNITSVSQSQYTQDFSSTMDLGLYDYTSLMHYGPRGFSRNGNPEMESIPVGIPFGDPPTFSVGDIDALNRLYFAAPSATTIVSNPAGLQVIVDGGTYTAPQTFNWPLNSSHTVSVPAGPQTLAGSSYIFGRWNNDLTGDLNASRTITVTPGSGKLGSPITAPANTVYEVNYIQLALYNPIPILDNNTSTTALAGSVSTTPAPTTYPGLTGQYFVNRQLVTLTATPAAGNSFYDFDGPNTSGQVFGPATNPVTLPADLIAGTIYVSFASQPEVKVTTSITDNNASGGMLTVTGGAAKPLPAAWSAANDTGWDAGTTHSVTAPTQFSPFNDAAIRYTFTGWTDGVTTTARSLTVPSTGLLSVGVNFATSYHAKSNVNNACAGSVSANPALPAGGFVPSGTALTFTATPTFPFVFANWGGSISGSANPVNTVATGEVIATANFNLINTPLTITSISPASLPVGSPAQSITITGTGFTPASTAFFLNDSGRDVTYVSPTTITVALLASDLAAPGILSTIVENAQSNCSVFVFGTSFLVTP